MLSVLDELPYPIAGPAAEIAREEDPNHRFRHLIRAFSATLKYSALLLVSHYLNGPMESDAVNEKLRCHLRRPSLGHWNSFIRVILTETPSGTGPPFLEDFRAFYFESGSKKPIQSVQIIDRLIQLRNEYIHPDIWPSQHEAQQLCEEHEPAFDRLLEALAVLGRYPLVGIPEARSEATVFSGPSPEAFRTVGAISGVETPGALYVCSSDRSQSWLMHPFVLHASDDREPRSELLLYETMRGRSVKYLLANQYRFDVGEHAQRLRGLLSELDARSRQRRLTEHRARAESRVSRRGVAEWSTLRDIALDRSMALIGPLRTDKYLHALYTERPEVNEAIQSFVASDRRGLSIVGDSGRGKTNILCRWIDNAESSEDIVLFMYGSEQEGKEFSRSIPKLLYQAQPLEELLAALDPEARERRAHLVILVDGVNEAPDPSGLCRQLIDLAQSFSYPWFKVVFTCRTVFWDTVLAEVAFSPDVFWFSDQGGDVRTKEGVLSPYVKLQRFSATELERAFDLYRDMFSLQSDFGALSEATRSMMSDPLMMRLISTVYEGRPIRGDIPGIDVFREYISAKVNERDLPFLDRITRVMMSCRKATLAEADIQRDPKLQEYVYEDPVQLNEVVRVCSVVSCPRSDLDRGDLVDGRCPACGREPREVVRDLRTTYFRLLDEAVIQELTMANGVLGVRFTYDRLFEYFLSGHLSEMELDPDRLSELIDSSASFTELFGATAATLARPERQALLVGLCEENDIRCQALATQSLLLKAAEAPRETFDLVRSLVERGSAVARANSLRAAGTLGYVDVLEAGCLHASSQTRAVAALAGYDLWEHRRERGEALVEALTAGSSLWNLPFRRRNIESALMLTVLVLSRHIDDEQVAGWFGRVWKGILGVGQDGDTRSRIERHLTRFLFVSAGVQVGTFVLKHWQVGGQYERCQEFFDQPQETRDLMSAHAHLLDPASDLPGSVEDLRRLGETQNYLLGKLLGGIICVHTFSDPRTTEPIAWHLLEEGDRFTRVHVIDGYGSQLVSNIARRAVDHETFDTLAHHAVDVTEQTETSPCFLWLAPYLECCRGEPFSKVIASEIRRAQETGNAKMLRACIDETTFAALDLSGYFGLRSLEPLFELEDGELRQFLIHNVAKLRARFPHETERYLMQSEQGRRLLKQADQVPVTEDVADIFMVGTVDLLVPSLCHFPAIRGRIQRIMERLPRANSVKKGLRIVAEELADALEEDASR